MATACERAFGTPELLELILLELQHINNDTAASTSQAYKPQSINNTAAASTSQVHEALTTKKASRYHRITSQDRAGSREAQKIKELYLIQRTSQYFLHTIKGSNQLRRVMWLPEILPAALVKEADSPTEATQAIPPTQVFNPVLAGLEKGLKVTLLGGTVTADFHLLAYGCLRTPFLYIDVRQGVQPDASTEEGPPSQATRLSADWKCMSILNRTPNVDLSQARCLMSFSGVGGRSDLAKFVMPAGRTFADVARVLARRMGLLEEIGAGGKKASSGGEEIVAGGEAD